MVSIGVLGINFKTADLALREAIARGAESLSGEKGIFFPYPTVLLSTCNRTEIYFSAEDLAVAHSDLLAHLRLQMGEPFEHRLYSYFGNDCFFHLCKVAAGLDSAIVAETEIQRQVKVAYANGKNLSSSLHFVFQKALKVSKEIRSRLEQGPSLYGMLWQLTEWENRQILLVGYSELNRGLISFLMHRGVKNISLCTRSCVELEGVTVFDRSVLMRWSDFDVVVCATKSDHYLISEKRKTNTVLFDLSVPRNVDPEVGAINIEEIGRLIEQKKTPEEFDSLIWDHVQRLSAIYAFKTQRVLENVGMGSHL